MKSILIQVQCYAGYKADESPRRFVCEDKEIEIEEIIDQWLQANKNQEQSKTDYFKVRGNDEHEYLLRHDQKSDQWFLENRW